MEITKEDKQVLIALLCEEQHRMLDADIHSFKSDKYLQLEQLKIKVKSENVI